MNKNTIYATWSWIVISILLEVVAAYDLTTMVWFVRGAVEGLLALTAMVPLILVYMNLWNEHISLKMFMIVSIFFCLDLILIWGASVAH